MKNLLKFLIGWMAFLIVSTHASSAPTQQAIYPADATSVFIPFTNVPTTETLQIKMGFSNGTPMNVTLDTGSTGIYVSPDVFGSTSNLTNIGACSETLTSSGIIWSGNLYVSQVSLYNNDNVAAVAQVPVCVVTSQTCENNPRHCTPNPNPTGLKYFGVGFGQELSGQPNGTPDKNPFLNIVSANSASGVPLTIMPSYGYILSIQANNAGATVGLTNQNTAGFSWIQLNLFANFSPNKNSNSPTPASKYITCEFQHAQGSITVTSPPTASYVSTGTTAVLFDTGVTTGYLAPPNNTNNQALIGTGPVNAVCNNASNCAASGTLVQVTFPTLTQSASSCNPKIAFPTTQSFSYSYTVGANTGVSPYALTVIANASPGALSFLNTTVSFLNGYNYVYDGANGFIGLQANP